MLKSITDFVSAGAEFATEKAVDGFEKVAQTLSAEKLEGLLIAATEKVSPVEVPVRCVPTGPKPDDYKIELDTSSLAAAMAAGRWVRPQFSIYAETDVNRDILSERLTEAAAVELENMQLRIDELRSEQMARHEAENKQVEETTDLMVTAFTGTVFTASLPFAGIIFPPLWPVLWVLLGLGALDILSTVLPRLFRGKMQQLFPNISYFKESEEKQAHALEEQMGTYEAMVKAMVKKARIMPL